MSPGFVHSLGVTLSVAVAALCVTDAALGTRRGGAARRRIRRLMGAAQHRAGAVALPQVPREAVRAWAPVLVVGLAVAVLVGGPAGYVAGPAVGCGLRAWRRRPRPASDETHADAALQLPLAADLMAACMAAGASPREVAEAVGCSLEGPLSEALTRVAAELRLGGDPSGCWGRLLPRELGRCMERACTTGVPPVDEVARLAAAHRAERRRAAVVRARRAGVLATAPLGLCFLPAFLLIGVAPVVMGLAEAIFTGGPK